jgi:lipopolysaccharide transport system ATP-binding protein
VTIAIAVEQLSKEYRLGGSRGTTMLREALVQLVRSPSKKKEEDAGRTLWALRDVSFEILTGEVVGIVGRNGAGKSTLLKILSRITQPTSGSARVRGRVASLLEVGTGFHEELTGRENVYLSGCLLGMPKKRIDAKLEAIVAFAEVERFLDTPIKHYSSGMRLRLGFAVAANLESDVLLVDEVLAVGDGEFQRKCLQAMGDLHATGRTVLFVSHNLAAVESLCSRAVWIDRGRLREDGPPKQVIQSYMSTFVRSEENTGDLREVPDRHGSGDIRFTKIEFLDAESGAPASIRSGDSFVVRLTYETRREIVQPIFGLEVHTSLGTMIAQIHTYNSGYDIPVLAAGPGYIDVRIDDLNLLPGSYSVSLFAANYGDIYHDVLPHCARLDVESSSRYGLMRGITKNPIVALPCRWTHGAGRPGERTGPRTAAG